MSILLFSISYKKNNNPLVQIQSDVGHQQLLIATDSSTFHWQKSQWDEKFFHIYIHGTLINKLDTIFYSDIGDGFGPAEQSHLHFAHNSGYLEKYDPNKHKWEEHDITGILEEGSRIVPVKPLQKYTFSSLLSRESHEIETGAYRFRVNYYDAIEPDSNAVLYHEYSNIFKLK